MKSRTEAARRAAASPPPRRTRAFTLLEVLAAVAILGILYTVFATFAIQGLRYEGENERRIRASLLADQVLADVELGMEDGEFPSEAGDESEEGEFLVRVELLPLTGLEGAGPDEGLAELLASDLSNLATDLHTVHVRVSWIEGAVEEEVTRYTYAWDSGPLYEQLGVTAGQPAAEDVPDDGTGAATAPGSNP